MVFIDRKNHISIYGLSDDQGLGFRQLRRIRQIRELGYKFLSLKKYEIGLYLVLLFAFLFSVMNFAQILFFSVSFTAFMWLIGSTITVPQQNFYYLKKDIKIIKPSIFGTRSKSSFLSHDNVDSSFGEELACSIVSSKYRPQKVFMALQGILMKLLMTNRRKRFIPFVSNSEVKGHILKSTNEDGVNRYFYQHFIKHGKTHIACIEIEKLSGQINHMFELKHIPRSSTIVLSVFMKDIDSASTAACVDALSRELSIACEEEDSINEATKHAYYKNCEFIHRSVTKPQDFDFDAIRAVPLETAQDYLPTQEDEIPVVKQPKVDTAEAPVVKPTEEAKAALTESTVEPKADEPKVTEPKSEEAKKEGMLETETSPTPALTPAPTPTLKPATPYNLEVVPEMPPAAIKLFEEKMKMMMEMNNINNGKWKLAETGKNGVTIYEDQKGTLQSCR
jgi:hypothetical protein